MRSILFSERRFGRRGDDATHLWRRMHRLNINFHMKYRGLHWDLAQFPHKLLPINKLITSVTASLQLQVTLRIKWSGESTKGIMGEEDRLFSVV